MGRMRWEAVGVRESVAQGVGIGGLGRARRSAKLGCRCNDGVISRFSSLKGSAMVDSDEKSKNQNFPLFPRQEYVHFQSMVYHLILQNENQHH